MSNHRPQPLARLSVIRLRPSSLASTNPPIHPHGMWSCTPGASSSSSPFSAGPSTPYSTEPSGSSSSSPTRPSSSKPKSVKRTSKPRKATKPSKANAPSPMPKPALAVEVWRDIFLEAFPILSVSLPSPSSSLPPKGSLNSRPRHRPSWTTGTRPVAGTVQSATLSTCPPRRARTRPRPSAVPPQSPRAPPPRAKARARANRAAGRHLAVGARSGKS